MAKTVGEIWTAMPTKLRVNFGLHVSFGKPLTDDTKAYLKANHVDSGDGYAAMAVKARL